MVEVKEEKSAAHESKKKDFTLMVRENPWMAATIVLGIIVLALIYFNLNPGSLSGKAAGEKFISYINTQTGGGVEFISSSDKGSLYEIQVSYQNQTIPVYVTKDGKYYAVGVSPLDASAQPTNADNTNAQPTEVPKTDKPSATLWVFSYCPYGTQTEKGFVPVYNLLKNKATLDIKFIGAMHGAYEKTESLRQLCIQKNYGQDKYFAYIDKFVADSAIGACSSDETCSKPLVEKLMTSLGIDVSKINSCMPTDGESLYAAQEAEAQSLGISGSPTLVVNDVQTQSGRSPAALLTAICLAFNTAPSECSQTLSTATPSAGFGSGASSASSAASCGV